MDSTYLQCPNLPPTSIPGWWRIPTHPFPLWLVSSQNQWTGTNVHVNSWEGDHKHSPILSLLKAISKRAPRLLPYTFSFLTPKSKVVSSEWYFGSDGLSWMVRIVASRYGNSNTTRILRNSLVPIKNKKLYRISTLLLYLLKNRISSKTRKVWEFPD